MNLTEMDWLRMADYLDTEGSISIIQDGHVYRLARSRRHHIRLTISNTVRALPDWCSAHFGGAVTRKKERNGCKPLYEWRACGYKAQAILKGCMPYFLLKRRQAEVALEFASTLQILRHRKSGLPLETIQYRDRLAAEVRALNLRGTG